MLMTINTSQHLQRPPSVAPIKLNAINDWSILWRCFRYLRPYWLTTAGTYGAMLLLTLVALVTPQFIRWIVDHGIRCKKAKFVPAHLVNAWLIGLDAGQRGADLSRRALVGDCVAECGL